MSVAALFVGRSVFTCSVHVEVLSEWHHENETVSCAQQLETKFMQPNWESVHTKVILNSFTS